MHRQAIECRGLTIELDELPGLSDAPWPDIAPEHRSLDHTGVGQGGTRNETSPRPKLRPLLSQRSSQFLQPKGLNTVSL